jgi:hypothetical protein
VDTAAAVGEAGVDEVGIDEVGIDEARVDEARIDEARVEALIDEAPWVAAAAEACGPADGRAGHVAGRADVAAPRRVDGLPESALPAVDADGPAEPAVSACAVAARATAEPMPSAEPMPTAAARVLMRCSCDATRDRATVARLSFASAGSLRNISPVGGDKAPTRPDRRCCAIFVRNREA